MKKEVSPLLIIVALVVIAALFGGYYMMSRRDATHTGPIANNTPHLTVGGRRIPIPAGGTATSGTEAGAQTSQANAGK
ncbi:MAG: hypothetical protein KGJ62_15630 [Armatimonadetes bacterium]|nr:hypothetical protein [Armatimonadota bacterium]MDE2206967.1 hypothetical protein [Armatimonadota bacterium]